MHGRCLKAVGGEEERKAGELWTLCDWSAPLKAASAYLAAGCACSRPKLLSTCRWRFSDPPITTWRIITTGSQGSCDNCNRETWIWMWGVYLPELERGIGGASCFFEGKPLQKGHIQLNKQDECNMQRCNLQVSANIRAQRFSFPLQWHAKFPFVCSLCNGTVKTPWENPCFAVT